MTPLPRLLAISACGLAGYVAGGAFTAPAPAPPISKAAATAKPVAKMERALVREWEEMRARHGGDAGEMAARYAEVKDLPDAFRRRAFRSALIAEQMEACGIRPRRAPIVRWSWMGRKSWRKQPQTAVFWALERSGSMTARRQPCNRSRARWPERPDRLPGLGF